MGRQHGAVIRIWQTALLKGRQANGGLHAQVARAGKTTLPFSAGRPAMPVCGERQSSGLTAWDKCRVRQGPVLRQPDCSHGR